MSEDEKPDKRIRDLENVVSALVPTVERIESAVERLAGAVSERQRTPWATVAAIAGMTMPIIFGAWAVLTANIDRVEALSARDFRDLDERLQREMQDKDRSIQTAIDHQRAAFEVHADRATTFFDTLRAWQIETSEKIGALREATAAR